MLIHTNENNTHTLKVLIAAKLAKENDVKIQKATLSDKFPGVIRTLPVVVVNEDLLYYSSNAALQHLLPVESGLQGKCDQLLEWECTRLYPAVMSVISTSKTPAVDLKQLVTSLVQDIEKQLKGTKYLLGDAVTSADISVWCTLYPLYNSVSSGVYFDSTPTVKSWYSVIAADKNVQDAVTQWGGSPKGPFTPCSPLGIQPIASLSSPQSNTPEDAAETGPSTEELEAAKESWLHGHEKLAKPIKGDKVLLPVKTRRNVLITSALPYVNNIPHLGNIIGCVLSGDIFARYCRACGYNTLYICGTDEYGTATETKALKENMTPKEICDKYHEIHKFVYDWFNIQFDQFGRTSTPQQTEIVQDMFLKLKGNGFIHSESVEQLLCKNCDRFLSDRFVEGTCPHPGCGYDDARGDQCDKCGKLCNAQDLIEPKCKLCKQKPVLKHSEQFFIDLALLEPSLRAWISRAEDGWTPSARAVTRSWLKEGLKSRCITRDLKWGVSVPIDGYRNKVFYVWFDAPLGYFSITKSYTENYLKWWKPDPETKVMLYQFMAKDNVPFHAILFPATLLGINEGHILVHHIFAIEYLNYEEGKFSKSRGVGVFGTDAKDTGIPVDVWRFYLASVRPEGQDSSFSWSELGTRNNSELLNNLGNFCHRSLSFCSSSFGGLVPDVTPDLSDYEMLSLVNRDYAGYVREMERGRLREALKHVMLISKHGNQYMQSNQPWVLLKSDSKADKERGGSVVGMCCQLVALLCTLISPYMPGTADRLARQVNINDLTINPDNPRVHRYLKPGHRIGKPEPLFAKLDMDRLMELKKKYAGTQDERADRGNGDGKPSTTGKVANISQLEDEIAKQGERVRKLKASTKDKSVWTPEVNTLLELKKKLAALKSDDVSKQPAPSGGGMSSAELEEAIAKQGERVRKLKASTKDKSVWTPEVNILLELKKKLAALKI